MAAEVLLSQVTLTPTTRDSCSIRTPKSSMKVTAICLCNSSQLITLSLWIIRTRLDLLSTQSIISILVLIAVELFKIWWSHHSKWIGQSLRPLYLHRLHRVPSKTTHVLISEPLRGQTRDKESIKYLLHLNLCLSNHHRKHCWCQGKQIMSARETALIAQSFNQLGSPINFLDHTLGCPNNLLKIRLLQWTLSPDSPQNPNRDFATADFNSPKPKIWSSRTSKPSMSSVWSS